MRLADGAGHRHSPLERLPRSPDTGADGCPPGTSEGIGGCPTLEEREETLELESACADGTASPEECFGPDADNSDNGVADANEYCDGTNSPSASHRANSPGAAGGEPATSGETQYDYFCNPDSSGYAPEYC